MTFFGEFARSPLGLIFLLLSLVNVYYGWRVARTAWQQRQALRREPLQPGQKRLLEQAAFFVAVPPGVLLHELFHALAVWLYGGRLVDGNLYNIAYGRAHSHRVVGSKPEGDGRAHIGGIHRVGGRHVGTGKAAGAQVAGCAAG